MVKHENDTDNIAELKKTNAHLKDQQQEYKSLLNQTMESLERNSTKFDSLSDEKKSLTKVSIFKFIILILIIIIIIYVKTNIKRMF